MSDSKDLSLPLLQDDACCACECHIHSCKRLSNRITWRRRWSPWIFVLVAYALLLSIAVVYLTFAGSVTSRFTHHGKSAVPTTGLDFVPTLYCTRVFAT